MASQDPGTVLRDWVAQAPDRRRILSRKEDLKVTRVVELKFVQDNKQLGGVLYFENEPLSLVATRLARTIRGLRG